MKKLFTLLLLLQLMYDTARAGEEIKFFEGSFNEAIAKATEQHKLLFLDCFTTWCGPCKWMAAHMFTNDTVAAYFNKTFICYKLDMEKGEGPEIARLYGVKNYPTYLWINANRNQVHRSVGTATTEAFMRIAQNAASTDHNLRFLGAQYQFGNKRPDLLLSYAYQLRDAYDTKYQTVADEYFHSLPAADLNKEENWKMILAFTPNMNSYIYGLMNKTPNTFTERYGTDSVARVLDMLALESMHYATQQKDSLLFDKAIAKLKVSKNKQMQKEGAHGELAYYKRNADMDKYTMKAPPYVKQYFWDDAKALNEICWAYFQKVDDKKKLGDAEKWIAQSVKLDDSYYNTDTYANILFKEGKNKQALEMTQHSIELAKKSGEDYASTQELLESIQKQGR